MGRKTVRSLGTETWNSLPEHLKAENTLTKFQNYVNTWFGKKISLQHLQICNVSFIIIVQFKMQNLFCFNGPRCLLSLSGRSFCDLSWGKVCQQITVFQLISDFFFHL